MGACDQVRKNQGGMINQRVGQRSSRRQRDHGAITDTSVMANDAEKERRDTGARLGCDGERQAHQFQFHVPKAITPAIGRS